MLAFSALADPTRRRIVELLGRGERSAGEIADEFDVSQPAISQHLKALRDAGLVQMRAEAQRRIYALDPAGLAAIDALARGRAPLLAGASSTPSSASCANRRRGESDERVRRGDRGGQRALPAARCRVRSSGSGST